MKVEKGEISRSFLWSASGTVLQVGAQMLALVALARLLSPYEFGVVSVAMLVTQFALVFSEFGVAPYVVQRMSPTPELLGTAFQLSGLFGLLVALIVWAAAPILEHFVKVPEVVPVLRAYCIVFLIKGWSAIQDALLQRDLDFRFLARADGWSFGVGYMLVSVACAAAGLSYWSIVIGHIVQAVLKAAFVVSRHPRLPSLPTSRGEARRMFDFGLGQTLSRLASYLGSQADSFVVASTLGVAPMGYYGRSNQLVTMPSFYLGQIFDRVIFPAVARIQQQRTEVAQAYRLSVGSVSLISMPFAAAMWMFAAPLVEVLLGPGWSTVIVPLQILALATPFRLIHKVSDPTARALGATYQRAWRQWVVAAVVTSGSLLMSRWGLAGVAAAVVFASTLDAALLAHLCSRLSHGPERDILRALLPGARVGLATAVLSGLTVFVCRRLGLGNVPILGVGAAVLGGLVWLVRTSPRILIGTSGQLMIGAIAADVTSMAKLEKGS